MDRHAAHALRRALLGVFHDFRTDEEYCTDCQTTADLAGHGHFGPTGNNVVTKAWNGSASRFSDQQYKMASAACDTSAGDSVKSQCFLPHHEPGGAVNKNGVHAAAQRVGSLSGKSAASVNTAKAHLRSHYKQMGEDPPSSIGGTSASEESTDFALDEAYAQELAIEGVDCFHGAFTGNHAHPHSSYGSQGGDDSHEHSHDHQGDTVHNHHGKAGDTGGTGFADAKLPTEWEAVLILEGVPTTDGREIAPGALKARPTPLPLMMMTQNEPGHFGSVLVGQITEVNRDPTTGLIMGKGNFDTEGENGAEAARLVGNQTLRWVSADLASDCQWEEVYPPGCDDYDCVIMRVVEGSIMGATLCPFPAFPQAVIVPDGEDLPAAATAGQGAAEGLGMVTGPQPKETASIIAAGFPVQPPAWWFEDPGFDGPAFGFRIDPSGRIYGHVALWGISHIGYQGRKVEAPHSATDYAYYNIGGLRCADDQEVTVGQITMDTGHASLAASLRSASAHYDNTGTAIADVHAGEDRYGIWIAGALRPSVTDEQLRALRAAKPSGDWRPHGRGKEMVAVLATNVPGFAAPRTSVGMRRRGELEEETALVAAGVPEGDIRSNEIAAEIAAQLAPWSAVLEELAPIAAERIAARAGL